MDHAHMNWSMSKRFSCLGCALLVKKSVHEATIYDNLFSITGHIAANYIHRSNSLKKNGPHRQQLSPSQYLTSSLSFYRKCMPFPFKDLS